jgi:GH35 family endo-1,4-beta-xylanase
MPPQQTVQTANPKVGVHTRLTDEVEEWKIQRSLAMVREMGAPWIVEYFPWAYIEPESGRYDWRHSDQVMKHARNQGLTVIARLGMVPAWARPKPEEQETTDTYLDDDHYASFAGFVATFAGRYKGRIHAIIIWNEPTLASSGVIARLIRQLTSICCARSIPSCTQPHLTSSCWPERWPQR